MANKGAYLLSVLVAVALCIYRGGCEEKKVTVPYNEVGKDFLIYWQRYNFLIMFYVPWCEYSIAADPIFYELADAFFNSSINIVKSDVSEHSDVGKFFKVAETPTIKFLKHGTIYSFDGLPVIENLLAFVSRVLSPEVRTIDSTNQLDAWKGNYSVLFMLLQPLKTNPEWQSIYKQVAKERLAESVFLQTADPQLVSQFAVKHTPTVLVMKDSTHYEYKDSLSSYAMGVWADSEKFPSCPRVNYTTAKPYLTLLSPGKKVVVLSTQEEEPSGVESKLVEVFRGIALERNFQRGYQFVWNVGHTLVGKITRESAQLPSLLVWDPEASLFYPYDKILNEETFTKKRVVRFLLSVTKGEVEAKGGGGIVDGILQVFASMNAVVWAMAFHYPALSVSGVALLVAGIIFFCYSKCSSNKRVEDLQKKNRKPRQTERSRDNHVTQPRNGNHNVTDPSDCGNGNGNGEGSGSSDTHVRNRHVNRSK